MTRATRRAVLIMSKCDDHTFFGNVGGVTPKTAATFIQQATAAHGKWVSEGRQPSEAPLYTHAPQPAITIHPKPTGPTPNGTFKPRIV